MTKVLFFGTHPNQFNGYSKVVYELMKCMSKMNDIQLTVYGFQNFYENQNHRPEMPSNVFVYDAFANERPKNMGFGVTEVQDFVNLNNPDVCIVYNDMIVISNIVNELKKIPNRKFKIITYVDQVYLNQKKVFIDFINNNSDVSILFTEYWKENILQQGLKTPAYALPHGFNPQAFYPIPKDIARRYFGIPQDDFIILNLNRNQPRKRWDICLKAFAELVSRNMDKPIKMVIATALIGAWNLIEIYERELSKRNITLEKGIQHIITIDNPQRITDEETNILYNVADIGINTCDGEGFGLCNFEQAGIGIPQVIPRLGGFIDYFNDENSILIDPSMAYYVDTTRDSVCGEALLIAYNDVVDAIETYYGDQNLRQKHGQSVREKILKNYAWSDIAEKLRQIIQEHTPSGVQEMKKDVSELVDDVEKIDTSDLEKFSTHPPPAPAPAPALQSDTKSSDEKEKSPEEKARICKEIEEMKQKLDTMLKSI